MTQWINMPLFFPDILINIKPMFLVEGPQGSGKFTLIKIVAKRMGLHLVNVNCNEIQSSTSAQTELKLRKALTNAENSIPCILAFRNIQVNTQLLKVFIINNFIRL